MKKKVARRVAVILCALCSVIWTGRVILEAVNQAYLQSVFWFLMNVLCAILWIVAFVVNYKSNRLSKEK